MIKSTQECLFCKKPTIFNVEIDSTGESCIICDVYYVTHNNNVGLIRFNMGNYYISLWPMVESCAVSKYHNKNGWKIINRFDFMPNLTPATAPKFLKRVIKLLSIS